MAKFPKNTVVVALVGVAALVGAVLLAKRAAGQEGGGGGGQTPCSGTDGFVNLDAFVLAGSGSGTVALTVCGAQFVASELPGPPSTYLNYKAGVPVNMVAPSVDARGNPFQYWYDTGNGGNQAAGVTTYSVTLAAGIAKDTRNIFAVYA